MAKNLGVEGVEVWLHEPGERFEIDEFDWRGGKWVDHEGLNAPALLPVTCERAEGVNGNANKLPVCRSLCRTHKSCLIISSSLLEARISRNAQRSLYLDCRINRNNARRTF